jgi:hypothetical protein
VSRVRGKGLHRLPPTVVGSSPDEEKLPAPLERSRRFAGTGAHFYEFVAAAQFPGFERAERTPGQPTGDRRRFAE